MIDEETKRRYASVIIDKDAIEAAKKDPNNFVRATERAIQASIENMKKLTKDKSNE